MDLKGKLRKGLHIFGSDNRDYGTIDRYDDQYAYVGERRIPVSAFERMDSDRLYLGADGGRYFADTAEACAATSGARIAAVTSASSRKTRCSPPSAPTT